MKRYVALLRGINISGKNKVPMAELKKCFEALDFMDVKTCLNSGNVIFSGNETDVTELTDRIERMIQRQFSLEIPVFVISQEELADILRHAPDWWGTENPEIYDNLIFILPPAGCQDVCHELGEPKEGLEQVQEYKAAVFWSFNRKDYRKTNWWSKTASVSIGSKLTIRTANTVRKIVSIGRRVNNNMNENIVIYVHGKGGSAEEAGHYKPLFPNSKVIAFDYHAQTPWEAKEEFPRFFAEQRKNCNSLTLVANSIGAFFSMSALDETFIDKAYFISPVVDMEKLIGNMMLWAGVSEQELSEKSEIPTDFGETLSWEYLCYVRKNPVSWRIPTHILYGWHDNLTSLETMSAFAKQTGAKLTVMPDGEHWFHTEEQMRFLDEWILSVE